MGEQVPDGDAVPYPLALRQPADDVIVEAEPPLFSEGNHTGGGELLSQRARLIDRAVAGGNLKLDVGKAESTRKQYAVAAEDPHRDPRDALPHQLGLDIGGDGIERRPAMFRREEAEEKTDRNMCHGALDSFCLVCETTARRSRAQPSASPSGGWNDQSSSARPEPARSRSRIPSRSIATDRRVRGVISSPILAFL